MPADYGDATVTRGDNGRLTVDRADNVIGISAELLANSQGLPVDDSGCIWLAGDPRYRYRPVRFARGTIGTLGAGLAGGRPDVVVCERVHDQACQVPGEHGQPICVRTIEQRPCYTCPTAPETQA